MKITLNELRKIVRSVLKEEENFDKKEVEFEYWNVYAIVDSKNNVIEIQSIDGENYLEKEDLFSREEDIEDNFKDIINAGVNIKYEGWEAAEFDDYLGYINIDLKSLNNAIKNHKLNYYIDEHDSVISKTLKESKESNPIIIFPDWLEEKIEQVHTKIGQGSIFSKSIANIKNIVLDTVKSHSNLDEISKTTGIIQIDVPNIGYDLVCTKKMLNTLNIKNKKTVEKYEGNTPITVNAVIVNDSIEKFSTNTLTIIVRPAKDSSGNIELNKYIILSVYPGNISAPRASEWGDDYFVIIPIKQNSIEENKPYKKNNNQLIKKIIKSIIKEEFSEDVRQPFY